MGLKRQIQQGDILRIEPPPLPCKDFLTGDRRINSCGLFEVFRGEVPKRYLCSARKWFSMADRPRECVDLCRLYA